MVPTTASPAPLTGVQVLRRDSACWLVLDRPEALNSLSPTMVAQLHRALDEAERDRSLRSLVLTGTGRAFCTGSDLKTARREGPPQQVAAESAAFVAQAAALLMRIERFPLPVIAAVNGLALAGGLELVLCCDLVVASSEARFGDAHARLGLLPGWGASFRLPRKIGVNRAKEMMYTAMQCDALQMQAWGLVNRVVPAAQLEAAVEALTAELGSKSPLGLARMKQLVDDGLGLASEVAQRNELTMAAAHFHSADRLEGIAAFAQKRAPVFVGR